MEKKSYTIPVVIGIIILGIVVFILWSNNAPSTTTSEPSSATSSSSDTTTPPIDNSTTYPASNSTTDSGNQDVAPVAPASIIVPLASENKSNEAGSATITKTGDKVKVAITLTGAPKGASQPAHIHLGSCDKPGAIKYPLPDIMNGASETTVNVSYEQLMSELPLSINVHKSAKEIKTYVACGNITVPQQ